MMCFLYLFVSFSGVSRSCSFKKDEQTEHLLGQLEISCGIDIVSRKALGSNGTSVLRFMSFVVEVFYQSRVDIHISWEYLSFSSS